MKKTYHSLVLEPALELELALGLELELEPELGPGLVPGPGPVPVPVHVPGHGQLGPKLTPEQGHLQLLRAIDDDVHERHVDGVDDGPEDQLLLRHLPEHPRHRRHCERQQCINFR